MRYELTRRRVALSPPFVATAEGAESYTIAADVLGLHESLEIKGGRGAVVGELKADWPAAGYTVTLADGRSAHVTGGRSPRVDWPGARARLKGRPAGGHYELTDGRRRVLKVDQRALSFSDTLLVEVKPGDERLGLGVAVALRRLAERAQNGG